MRSTPRYWPSIHQRISSSPTSAICSTTISLHSSRRTERQTSRRGNKIAATSALLEDTMETTYGVHGQEQQFQGRRLSRQRPYSLSRFRLRLRGQQPIAASGVVGSTRRHEELRHYPTGSGFWPWLVVNIPPNVTELAVDAGNPKAPQLPRGALQTRTDFGTPGYGGPCPPAGDHPHRYLFTVFAVGTDSLPVTADTSAAVIGFQLHFSTLAKAAIMGLYKR